MDIDMDIDDYIQFNLFMRIIFHLFLVKRISLKVLEI